MDDLSDCPGVRLPSRLSIFAVVCPEVLVWSKCRHLADSDSAEDAAHECDIIIHTVDNACLWTDKWCVILDGHWLNRRLRSKRTLLEVNHRTTSCASLWMDEESISFALFCKLLVADDVVHHLFLIIANDQTPIKFGLS